MPKNRVATTLLLAAGAVSMWTAVATAAGPDQGSDATEAARRAQGDPEHDAMLQSRLDRAADRLEIKASQQAAWNDYSAAIKALTQRTRGIDRSDATPDAATLARQRAQRATDMAQKLTRVADATGKLQAVLSADQRETLNALSRAERGGFGPQRAMFMHSGRGGPEPQMGPHHEAGGRGPARWGRGDQDRRASRADNDHASGAGAGDPPASEAGASPQ